MLRSFFWCLCFYNWERSWASSPSWTWWRTAWESCPNLRHQCEITEKHQQTERKNLQLCNNYFYHLLPFKVSLRKLLIQLSNKKGQFRGYFVGLGISRYFHHLGIIETACQMWKFMITSAYFWTLFAVKDSSHSGAIFLNGSKFVFVSRPWSKFEKSFHCMFPTLHRMQGLWSKNCPSGQLLREWSETSPKSSLALKKWSSF